MNEDNRHWTNVEIFQEVFRGIIRRITDDASREVTLNNFKEALAKQDTTDFEDLLIEMELRPLYNLMVWLDGGIAPAKWPGVKLVNQQTGEPLSNDFGMELTDVIYDAGLS